MQISTISKFYSLTMQLNLSNLVDLALGKPHYLDCENFSFLHTLLHVVLRKVNLSNTCVELTDELAERAENLMKYLPEQPSICFKEVRLNGCVGAFIVIFSLRSSY